ncbi:MAG: radical SAM protein [bacterium]|nr:radical SAM protein [bacterium]
MTLTKQKIVTVGWTYTSKCNLNCVHCYNSSSMNHQDDELSLDDAVSVLEKLKDYGVEDINYGGGENTMLPQFWAIAKYAKELGLHQSLTTNGTIMTETMADACAELFDDVGVSIDFHQAISNDKFRLSMNGGTFTKAVHAAKLLVRRKVNTEIVMCLNRLNCKPETLQGMIEMCEGLGVGSLRMNTFRPVGRGEYDKQLTMNPQELEGSYRFFFDKMSENGTTITTPDPLFSLLGGQYMTDSGCPCGKTSMRIQSNGDVTPCVFMSLSAGNILRDSIDDIYNSELFQRFQHQEPVGKCSICPRWNICRGGCIGRKWALNGSFDGPDPLCWWEPGMAMGILPELVNPGSYNIHERYLCTFYFPIETQQMASMVMAV